MAHLETAKDAIIHIRKVAEEEFEDMGTKFCGPTLNKPRIGNLERIAKK